MPGDTVKMEVYAKYIDPNTSNWTGGLSTLMGQIAGNASGVVVDGINYSTSTSTFPSGFGGLQSTTSSGAPKAYLNWLVFDRSYRYLTGGFKQITTAAKEAGSDISHERIAPSGDLIITEPGNVYIYLSNEETTPVEVFFDDFRVTHVKSPIIQSEDFYAFGLGFNEYQRENSPLNKYLYNGKEKQDALNLDWFDYGARMYMADIARWGAIDPKSEVNRRWTPYNYAYNNSIRFIDPDGMLALDPYLLYKGDTKKLEVWDDNDTPDDYSDDLLLSSNEAKNQTTNSSNGKWEDGEYEMEDTETPYMHGNAVDANNILKDSDNGAYGSGGIYRARNFQQTTPSMTRSGMGVHAGRESSDWETARKTEGCIRVKPEGFDKIGEAIEAKGPLTKIVVQNNRTSTNSTTTNAIKPGSAYVAQAQNAHEMAVEDSTRIMQ